MQRTLFAAEPTLDEGDEGYRPLSVGAVVAAIAGVLSPLVFIGPSLWFVPAIGASAAAFSLRAMSRPGVAMIGRGAAIAGLVLSVACGAAGVTSWLFSWGIAERHAVAAAEAWVGLVRDGRLLEARSMLAKEAVPVGMTAVAGNADEFSRPIDDSALHEAAMRDLPAVAAIAKCGSTAAAAGTFQAFVPDSEEFKEDWQVRVRIAPCAGDDPLSCLFHLRRAMAEDATTWSGWVETWAITAVQIGD